MLGLYEASANRTRDAIARLVEPDEVESLASKTREVFVALLPEIPYRAQPGHAMFLSTFGVFTALAL